MIVSAQLCIDYVHCATIGPDKIHCLNNELTFFTREVYHRRSPYTIFMIRLVYNKNCIEHAKIFVTCRLLPSKDIFDKEEQELPDVAICSDASVTGKEIPLLYRDRKLLVSPDSPLFEKILKYRPTYKLSRPSEHMHIYSFEVPHIGKLVNATLHNGADIARLKVNENVLSVIVLNSFKKNGTSEELKFFRKENGTEHRLKTTWCSYSNIFIEILSKEKLRDVHIDLIFNTKNNSDKPKNKIIHLTDNKTMVYSGGNLKMGK